MFCSKCGKEIDNQAIVCPSCGVATSNYSAPQSPQAQPNIIINNTNTNTNTNAGFGYVNKSKWTAFFLCLFLGCLGAHRFYVGKTGTGIIWLLTAGFGGFGALIDLIFILTGGFKDRVGQPLV